MYIYHSVPKILQGTILYPLNVLKERYFHIYAEQFSKYRGREHITAWKIPLLDCLWNDVLHFSAVHPKEIKEALIEAGDDSNFVMNYYQIDSKLLDPKNTVIYLYTYSNNRNEINKDNIIAYNPDNLSQFSIMLQATKDYYKETIAKGEKPLLYHKIPHILYRGILDVKDLEIITV